MSLTFPFFPFFLPPHEGRATYEVFKRQGESYTDQGLLATDLVILSITQLPSTIPELEPNKIDSAEGIGNGIGYCLRGISFLSVDERRSLTSMVVTQRIVPIKPFRRAPNRSYIRHHGWRRHYVGSQNAFGCAQHSILARYESHRTPVGSHWT
ncbi:hypothetical protein TNCV_2552611 [Trichonephila clavipes]|nr:hypothetical protein TNCV_2552611 [Trichonephila clavipes]